MPRPQIPNTIHSLIAAGLAAFAILGTAEMAQARESLLNTTFNVSNLAGGFIGCDNAESSTSKQCSSALGDDTLEINGTDYTITRIAMDADDTNLDLDGYVSDDDAATLVFTFGTDSRGNRYDPFIPNRLKDRTAASTTLEFLDTSALEPGPNSLWVDKAGVLKATFTDINHYFGGGGKVHYVVDLKVDELAHQFVFCIRRTAGRGCKVFTDVENATIVKAKRMGTRRRTVDGVTKAYTKRWRLTIRTSEAATRTSLTLPSRNCIVAGAMCGINGELIVVPTTWEAPNAMGLSHLDQGLYVDDAEGDEDEGEIVFNIGLRYPHHAGVEFYVETIDSGSDKGTATPNSDYTPLARTKMVLLAGQTSKQVSIPLTDDTVNDDGETVKFKISGARMLQNRRGDHSRRSRWANNIPTWSRTTDNMGVETFDVNGIATGTIRNSGPVPKKWTARFARTVASQAVDAISGQLEGNGGGHVTVAGRSLTGGPPPGPGGVMAREESMSMSAREVLGTSSFQFSSGDAGGGTRWNAWGNVARSGFHGQDEGNDTDGYVTTAFLGNDIGDDDWRVGFALGHSEGSGSYDADTTLESTLTSLYPYAGWALTDHIDLWALMGLGRGSLTVTQHSQDMPDQQHKPDISVMLAAAGIRGAIVEPGDSGGFGMAVKSDAFWTQIETEDVEGLRATDANVTRARVLLEANYTLKTVMGKFEPSASIGVRQDGGDAETGMGLESAVGLDWTDGRFAAGLDAKVLAAHSSGYEEWSASGYASVSPGAGGRGLSVSIIPGWGTGVESVWDMQQGFAAEKALPDRHVTSELAYGVALRDGVLLTPYSSATFADENVQRLGVRWNFTPNARLGLEASHSTDTSIMLQGKVRL